MADFVGTEVGDRPFDFAEHYLILPTKPISQRRVEGERPLMMSGAFDTKPFVFIKSFAHDERTSLPLEYFRR